MIQRIPYSTMSSQKGDVYISGDVLLMRDVFDPHTCMHTRIHIPECATQCVCSKPFMILWNYLFFNISLCLYCLSSPTRMWICETGHINTHTHTHRYVSLYLSVKRKEEGKGESGKGKERQEDRENDKANVKYLTIGKGYPRRLFSYFSESLKLFKDE